MEDNTFIAKLISEDLLPGDTKSKIESQSISADKASYFLTNVIKRSIEIGNIDSFNKLISVMEHCDFKYLNGLALEIKSTIDGM